MRRKQAAKLIDAIRELSARHIEAFGSSPDSAVVHMRKIADLLSDAGLAPLNVCQGEAHSNAHIDNCSLCAPRWGFVGKFEVVS